MLSWVCDLGHRHFHRDNLYEVVDRYIESERKSQSLYRVVGFADEGIKYLEYQDTWQMVQALNYSVHEINRKIRLGKFEGVEIKRVGNTNYGLISHNVHMVFYSRGPSAPTDRRGY